MIVMGVVGVALGGGLAGLVAAQFMSAPPVPRADRTARPALRLPTDVANRELRGERWSGRRCAAPTDPLRETLRHWIQK